MKQLVQLMVKMTQTMFVEANNKDKRTYVQSL